MDKTQFQRSVNIMALQKGTQRKDHANNRTVSLYCFPETVTEILPHIIIAFWKKVPYNKHSKIIIQLISIYFTDAMSREF